MSEILKDRAVILRTHEFGESSLVAVALTRGHGKLRFLAKGARRPRSPFAGMLRTGGIGDVVFYYRPEGGLQLLKEFWACGPQRRLEEDFVKLCLFQAGLEIVDISVVDRESDEPTFGVLEEFSARLFASSAPWRVFFALEVRLLKALGVLPAIDRCGRCGRSVSGRSCAVDPAAGTVACRRCGRGGALPLSAEAVASLGLMAGEPFERIGETEVSPRERREIGQLLHGLFLHHVEGYRLPNALQLLRGVA
jgi:DNA repair protein RecO (recombination protein O)